MPGRGLCYGSPSTVPGAQSPSHTGHGSRSRTTWVQKRVSSSCSPPGFWQVAQIKRPVATDDDDLGCRGTILPHRGCCIHSPSYQPLRGDPTAFLSEGAGEGCAAGGRRAGSAQRPKATKHGQPRARPPKPRGEPPQTPVEGKVLVVGTGRCHPPSIPSTSAGWGQRPSRVHPWAAAPPGPSPFHPERQSLASLPSESGSNLLRHPRRQPQVRQSTLRKHELKEARPQFLTDLQTEQQAANTNAPCLYNHTVVFQSVWRVC